MPKTGKSVQGGTINYSQWDHIEVFFFRFNTNKTRYLIFLSFVPCILMRFVGIR